MIILVFLSQMLFASEGATDAIFADSLEETTAPLQASSVDAESEARQSAYEFNQLVDQLRQDITYCETNFASVPGSKQVCMQDVTRNYVSQIKLKQLSSLNACIRTASITQKSCLASTYMPWASLLINQFKNASSTGMANQCKKAANFQQGMGVISSALAATCYFTKKKCETACNTVNENFGSGLNKLDRILARIDSTASVELTTQVNELRADITKIENSENQCEENELNIMSALVGVQQFMSGFAQSRACQDTLANQNECLQPGAENNPNCSAAFCSNPTNAQDPQCAAFFGECNGPNAASNPRCVCLQNPLAEGCNNLPPLNNPGINTAGLPDDNLDTFNFDQEDFGADEGEIPLGDPNAAAPGTVGSFSGGGGAGGPGKGNALGGGPKSGGNRKPGSVYDTNVTGGTKNGFGAAGGGGGGGAGYNAGGGNARGGGYNPAAAPRGSKLDLKKYLPGGKIAKQRAAAGNKEITGSMGLGNFEKIRRAHNYQRNQLVGP